MTQSKCCARIQRTLRHVRPVNRRSPTLALEPYHARQIRIASSRDASGSQSTSELLPAAGVDFEANAGTGKAWIYVAQRTGFKDEDLPNAGLQRPTCGCVDLSDVSDQIRTTPSARLGQGVAYLP